MTCKIEHIENEWFVDGNRIGSKVEDVVNGFPIYGKTFLRTACSCAKDFSRPVSIQKGANGAWVVVLLERVAHETDLNAFRR